MAHFHHQHFRRRWFRSVTIVTFITEQQITGIMRHMQHFLRYRSGPIQPFRKPE
jgi:hypothetical protein